MELLCGQQQKTVLVHEAAPGVDAFNCVSVKQYAAEKEHTYIEIKEDLPWN